MSHHAYRVYYGTTYYLVGAPNVRHAIKEARRARRAFILTNKRDDAPVTKIERIEGGDAVEVKLPPGTNIVPPLAVLFRQWKSGDEEVLAIFPETPASAQGYRMCSSYAHLGQHGAADPELVMKDTRPATEKEYRPLLKELRKIGYTKLVIRHRYTEKMFWKRRRDWVAMMAQPKQEDAADTFQAAMGR